MSIADVASAAGLRTPIRHQLFIGGRFVDAQSAETLATLNPHDNTTIAEVAMAGKADIDAAVAAADRAFPAWSRMAAADRGRILLKVADLVEANADELVALECEWQRVDSRHDRSHIESLPLLGAHLLQLTGDLARNHHVFRLEVAIRVACDRLPARRQ